ncbi:ACP phosphodiesterase [Halarcobacter ebronensis]|uniref:ACP phosphodiesterase n=1 Tax=Halarcobacter ebronensis TaxID=1462615 RepID=A0A4Q1AM72_9BACT|nr:ACP phosphodiesterase [Halarcobacter ebronensis]QKF81736.1 DUF479 domain-containing protein [Halarcobacter ebronensis]RXK04586.1 hypothetical protein CRV07_10550 [Halarcobacter ebronensis]
MNWIAHIFLSEYNINFQIANYLADPLKGRIWEKANENIKKGMSTHKKIDAYTDSHEKFKKSKNRLGEKGLLKAVVMDLTYDYLLTKNWNKFCNIPQKEFLDTFHYNAKKELKNIPQEASFYLKRLIEHEILHQYNSLEELQIAFNRVDYKLSSRLKSRDNCSRYLNIVEKNIEGIEEDFLLFFPQLCFEIKKSLDKTKIDHWKI